MTLSTIIARIYRKITGRLTVEDADEQFNKIRGQYVAAQKESIRCRVHAEEQIKVQKAIKEVAERNQKRSEKRIATLNTMLED